ncbi:MAG TPA: OmpA family protein [Candidatus Kapabacteria bacterium]|nr:OmpA family protein [Candidatus Kapabacteria bacterium]
MKISIIVILITLSTMELFAQFNIPNIIKRKVEEKVEQKTEEAIEKALEGNEDDEQNEQQNKNINRKDSDNEQQFKQATLKSYSKFDFIPGEDIIFFEDFSKDAIGDFPARWNTNGTGEVVTINEYPGKWLKMYGDVYYVPEMKYPFPDNYTFEYDLIVMISDIDQDELSYGRYGWFRTEIASMHVPSQPVSGEMYSSENAFNNIFEFEYGFGSNSLFSIGNNFRNEGGGIHNTNEFKYLAGYLAKPIHISYTVNKQRFRVYVNENKVYDIPRFFPKDDLANIIRFHTSSLHDNRQYQILLSNIRLAAATTDDRSKLLTEGKVVTNAIKFDVASDVIKAESYTAIKSIADVLHANPTVKVKIVGHTDSDGNHEKNISLSKQRAESVKKALINEFKIEASRLETDGKGATIPIGDNNNTEGKAQNRRVEFIKL